MEISFTKLRIYLECPWKYKLFFIDGRRIPLNPQSALGLTLHRSFERFARAGAESWDELLDCYDKDWLASGYPDGETERRWKEKGRRILRKWLDQENESRHELVAVERELIYPLGRHVVRGMIDRIDRLPDGKLELIDYKTQFSMGPADPPAAPPNENLQLRFYALGARESLGLKADILTVHYLAAGRRESAPYDGAGEEELKALIMRTADKIESGDWAAETSFCPRCDFRKDCRFSVAPN